MKIITDNYYIIKLYGKPSIARILIPNKKDKPIKIETLWVFIDHRVVRHQVSKDIKQKKIKRILSYKNKQEALENGKEFLEFEYPELLI